MDDEVAGVVAPPPLIYLGFLGAGLVVDRLTAARLPLPPRAGLPLVAGGAALGGWFLQTLRAAGTPPEPWEPTVALATGGAYRYSRNPGYLAMALLYAGLAVLARSTGAALLLPAAVQVIRRGVIEREELYLEHRFGATYVAYRSGVRRWL